VRDVSETLSPESIARRLDGLQNSVSGVTRRMVTLESNLAHGTEAIAAELAGLQARVDQLASALETSVNCLILLVERIAQSQLPRRGAEVDYPQDITGNRMAAAAGWSP